MRFHVIRSQTPNPAQSPLRVIEHETAGGRLGQSLPRREYVAACGHHAAQLRLRSAALCALVESLHHTATCSKLT